jgi:hypothetical protein
VNGQRVREAFLKMAMRFRRRNTAAG